MEKIDYKNLLLRYIALVSLAEGDDFLSCFGCGLAKDVHFTEEEKRILNELSDKSMDIYNHD